MPNPNANKPLTFEQIKADAMSMGIPVRALMDMIASGARSSVATTLGLPSDLANTAIGVHNMARDIRRGKFQGYEPGTIPMGSEQIKEFIPDVSKDPNSNLNKMADFGGNFAVIPRSGELAMKGLKSVGQEIADRVATGQGLIPKVGEPQMAMFAVKPKGGSWLNDSTERFLGGLKSENRLISPSLLKGFEQSAKDPTDPLRERSIRRLREHNNEIAVNNWVDKNLNNYVKNEMGTEHDPVRKLADQGIIHTPIDDRHISESLIRNRRREANLPEEGFATTELGKKWEKLTDEAIKNVPVKEYLDENRYQVWGGRLPSQPFKNEAEADEYIRKVNEVLGHKPFGGEGLTLNEILKTEPFVKSEIGPIHQNPWLLKKNPEDIVHESYGFNDLGFDHLMDVLKEDLANGRIQPEDLKNYSVDRAVRRAHEYNEDLAKKMAETAIKQTEDMPVVKEYPSGHKWIELAPKEVKSKADLGDLGLQSYFDYMKSGGDEAYALKAGQKADAKKYVEEALQYEGDKMGHCVGGYCPDVLEGRTRIFSLRDKRGEPHVTIEAKNPKIYTEDDVFDQFPGGVTDALKRGDIGAKKYVASKLEELNANSRTPNIHQIKGKGNQAPVDKYLPMVQDFQRTTGFPIKGDIHNSGFVDTHPELKKLGESIGLKVPDYLTKEEENVLHQQVAPHIESMVKNANDFLDTHPAFEPHRQATREFYDALGKEFSTNEPYTQQVFFKMNELERRSLQSIHPEFPYHFSEIKKVLNNPEEHGEGDPLKTQLYNLGKINELRNKVGDVPTAQPTLPIEPTQGFASGGAVQHQGFINPSLKLANGSVTLNPLEFMPNYDVGGVVKSLATPNNISRLTDIPYINDAVQAAQKGNYGDLIGSAVNTLLPTGAALATYSPELNSNEASDLSKTQYVQGHFGRQPRTWTNGMAVGGKVHVSDDLDMMRHELNTRG